MRVQAPYVACICTECMALPATRRPAPGCTNTETTGPARIEHLSYISPRTAAVTRHQAVQRPPPRQPQAQEAVGTCVVLAPADVSDAFVDYWSEICENSQRPGGTQLRMGIKARRLLTAVQAQTTGRFVCATMVSAKAVSLRILTATCSRGACVLTSELMATAPDHRRRGHAQRLLLYSITCCPAFVASAPGCLGRSVCMRLDLVGNGAEGVVRRCIAPHSWIRLGIVGEAATLEWQPQMAAAAAALCLNNLKISFAKHMSKKLYSPSILINIYFVLNQKRMR